MRAGSVAAAVIGHLLSVRSLSGDRADLRADRRQTLVEDAHQLVDLRRSDRQRRTVEEVGGGETVDGAGEGIGDETALEGFGGDTLAELPFRRERLLRRTVADELDAGQQPQAADVANQRVAIFEVVEAGEEVGADVRGVADQV